jgi:hypothetical protein
MLKFWLVVSQGKFWLYMYTIFRINYGAIVICQSSCDYKKTIKIVQELTDGVVSPTKIIGDKALQTFLFHSLLKNGIYCCALRTVSSVLAVRGCNDLSSRTFAESVR